MQNTPPLSDSDIRFLNHLRGVDGIKHGKSYPSEPTKPKEDNEMTQRQADQDK